MTYKTMRRKGELQDKGLTKRGVGKGIAAWEEFLDGCLKEGTDQGWTLHTFTHSAGGLAGGTFFAFIWDTND